MTVRQDGRIVRELTVAAGQTAQVPFTLDKAGNTVLIHTGLKSGFAANSGQDAQISYTRSLFVASQAETSRYAKSGLACSTRTR